MNSYKITFTHENGTEGFSHITALNERQARKDFNEDYRHSNGTIVSVELVSENAPATKQQERDALKKIRAIVDTLGPQSYVATAFEGCFDDAEDNIENDFGFSMKSRYETAENNAAYFKRAAENFSAEHDKALEKIAQLKAELEAMQAKVLAPDDLLDCESLTKDLVCEKSEARDAAAAKIVEHAENPESEEFRSAVLAHRDYKSIVDYYNGLKTRIRAAIDAGHCDVITAGA